MTVHHFLSGITKHTCGKERMISETKVLDKTERDKKSGA